MAKNFDKILQEIGEFGRYQKLIFFMIGLIFVFCGAQTILIVLLGGEMHFRCANDTSINTTWSDVPTDELRLYNISQIQAVNNSHYSGTKLIPGYDKRTNYIWTNGNWSRRNRTNADQTNEWTDSCKRQDGEKCTEFEFDTSFFTSTMRSQWSLVCDRDFMVAMVQTCFMAGWLAGVSATGYFSDRFGRRVVVLTCLVLQIANNAGAAYVTNYTLFVIFRFVAGLITGSVLTTGYVLCVEFCGLKTRAYVGLWTEAFFAAGFMSLAGIGYFIHDHRQLQLVLGLVPAPLLIYYWILPESARWLLSVKKFAKAEVVIERMARINGHGTVCDEWTRESMSDSCSEMTSQTDESVSMLDSMRLPNLRRVVIICFCDWFVASFVYYGIILSGASLGVNIYLNLFIVGAIEIPAVALGTVLVERAGRTILVGMGFVVAGVCCLTCSFLIGVEGLNWLLVTTAMIGQFAIALAFTLMYLYTVEVLPTVIRNSGIGWCSTFARIGGLIAPQVARLGHVWTILPFLIFAIAPLVCAFLTFLLPDTRGKTLPGTMLEGEELAKNFGCFGRRKHQEPITNIKDQEFQDIVQTNGKPDIL